MFSLEQKIRPPLLEAPWPRDMFGLGLLVALAAILIPAWDISGQRYLNDVAGQMSSVYLLPALGFMLALRCGAIDFSVWVSAAGGGLVAAVLVRAGVPAGWAFGAAAAAGLMFGAVNAVLVVRARLPSIIVTAVAAIAATVLLQAVAGGRTVTIPAETFEGWHRGPMIPLPVVRMLVVAGAYSLTMLVLLGGDLAIRRGLHISRRQELFAALCASGALSAVGGACWLINHGAAPVPAMPIGDLRIPAAAVLAGGVFFAGRGRTLLAGVCLPGAMLLVTVWRQEVWDLPASGHALQILVLVGMTVMVHVAGANALASWRRGRVLSLSAAILSFMGLGILTAAAGVTGCAARKIFHVAGLATWSAGALGVVGWSILARRRTRSLSEQ